MTKPYDKIFNKLKKKQEKETMLEEFQRERTSFEILISTLMSARTKDSTTIPIAKKLFKKYNTPEELAELSEEEIADEIYGVGFYNQKAGQIKELSNILLKEYNGETPDSYEDLVSLPGVGRKTANCVLVYAFNKDVIAVDTHVHRISNRLGLVDTEKPEQTEKELKKILPKKHWSKVNERLVTHGQTICKPKKPKCSKCSIKNWCDYYKNNRE